MDKSDKFVVDRICAILADEQDWGADQLSAIGELLLCTGNGGMNDSDEFVSLRDEKQSEVDFYDNCGGWTYSRLANQIDPFSQSMKRHFHYGGFALVDGLRVTSHNALAERIGKSLETAK